MAQTVGSIAKHCYYRRADSPVVTVSTHATDEEEAAKSSAERPFSAATECRAGERAGELRQIHVVHDCSAVDRCSDTEQACPSSPSFCVAMTVGQAADDYMDSQTATAGLAAHPVEQEHLLGQPPRQEQQRNSPDRQSQDRPRRKQVVHQQGQQQQARQSAGSRQQMQQQQEDGDDILQRQSRRASIEQLKRSISGLRRLSSITRLSSGEFRTWEMFLLPTAAAALSVPMLVLVGCAPVFCMILFILWLQNVLAAMFMMHWVCMVAVPLLYIVYVERSFDYYVHVWAVQSCRFATQWKRALLLCCGTAVSIYGMYCLLRFWGGAWVAALVDMARSRALAGGLDLPLGPLLVVGCYFCICNPIIEEWFWRIFLYREFGGAVFFPAENRAGLFVLKETPTGDSRTAAEAALRSAVPVDVGSISRHRSAIYKARRSDSFTADTDVHSYRELQSESNAAAAATGEKGTRRAGAAAKTASSSSSWRIPTAARNTSCGASSGVADDTRSAGSIGGADPAPFSAFARQAGVAAVQDVRDTNRIHSEDRISAVRTGRAALLRSTSISLQPTARTDPLLIDARTDAEGHAAYAAPFASASPPASPLARVTGFPSFARIARLDSSSSHTTSLSSPASRVWETRDGALELLPVESVEVERKGTISNHIGDGVSTTPSPPAPDAPIVTHVGGGLLQVDLRLSLLGQVVLSLFYASYHTVVFGFLTGVLGGCIALPSIAVLGMIFIFLRNSCFFGLLGGVLMHIGVDLGGVLVLGAVLEYYG